MFRRWFQLLAELESDRHFVKLWLSQLLSLVAFNMVNFTLLVRVFDLTHSSIMVSLFILSFGLPSLLFGALAGALVDRWDRRKVLWLSSAARIVLVASYLLVLDSVAAIYLITFLLATASQFFTPAEAALIPELVDRKRLVAANTVFMMTLFISFILGYGLSGPLAATGGDQLPIKLAVAMFSFATAACLLLPSDQHVRQRADSFRQLVGETISQIRDGFRLLRQTALVRYGVSQLTFVWAAIGVVMVILPSYTHNVLHLDLHEISRAVLIPFGIGMLAGGVALHWLRHRPRRTIITIALLIASVSVLVMGQVNSLVMELPEAAWLRQFEISDLQQLGVAWAATLLGLAMAIVMIAAQTMVHEGTKASARGRIFGVLGVSINAANTLPILLTGSLLDIYSVVNVVTALAIVLAVWAVISRLIGRVDTPLPIS